MICDGVYQFSSKGEGSGWLLVNGDPSKRMLLAWWDETMDELPHGDQINGWNARVTGQLVVYINFDGSRSFDFENIKRIVLTRQNWKQKKAGQAITEEVSLSMVPLVGRARNPGQ